MESSDLKIIQTLYFTNETSFVVFDPEQRLISPCSASWKLIKSIDDLIGCNDCIVFNLSKQKNAFDFNHSNIKNVVHFNSSSNGSKKFYFINNPDGSIRWISPSNNSSAVFLSLYNNSGWKAVLYKFIMKLSFFLQIESFLFDGYFSLQNKTTSVSDFLPKEYVDEYAIFTGTKGENRKAIVAISAHNYVKCFVKIPLTNKARLLVQNERKQLEYLQGLDLIKMRTPKCSGSENHLIMSNVKPVSPIAQKQICDIHFVGIAEYYNKTSKTTSLKSTLAWHEIADNLEKLNRSIEIKNDLSHHQINNISSCLNQLVEWLGDHENVPVGLAHGDFTPWNTYLSKEKLHVYDWEMSRLDMPLLFDVFHYVFQNNILIQQNNYDTIKAVLEGIQTNEIIQSISEQYNLDWSVHYAFYLSYITSYYLPLYVEQNDLHTQAHWLVNIWEEALVDITMNLSEKILIPELN